MTTVTVDRRRAGGRRRADRAPRNSIMAALVTLAVLQVADVVSTRMSFANGGVETNPLLGRFGGGSLTLLAVKFAAVFGCWLLARRSPTVLAVAAVWCVVGIYVVVVAANLTVAGA